MTGKTFAATGWFLILCDEAICLSLIRPVGMKIGNGVSVQQVDSMTP